MSGQYAELVERLKDHADKCGNCEGDGYFVSDGVRSPCVRCATEREAAAALTTLTQDAKRFEWCLPILTAQGQLGDNRALRLASQFLRNLDGREAIDAAMEGKADE